MLKYSITFLRTLLIKGFVLFLMLFIISITVAQDVYRTKNGNMFVTVVSSDTILTLRTKAIVISLNNSTAKFTMYIDRSTFVTESDSLNELLVAKKFDLITFSGKLGVETIDRHFHSPIDFDVEGIISTTNKAIKGRGRLEHISSEGDLSCLLTLKFNLNKNDLGLNLDGLNIKDDIQIDVVQVLLNN